MGRQLATIQTVAEIQPIEGADKIVKARINGWWVVTGKENNFKEGDPCVYFEIDSFLPVVPTFEFLLKGSKPKKMIVDGVEKEGIRLRTVKLRGQISQGLIIPTTEFANLIPDSKIAIGEDVSEFLNVIKYEAPIPPELSGKVKGSFPSFIPKTDEERIQNIKGLLGGFYVAEKLDGTSVTYFKKEGVFGVCSRNLELLESEGNTQWRLAREMDLENKIPNFFALQGELVGEGIQGNPLKIKGQKVYFYNAYNIATGIYLNFENFKQIIQELGLETVPILDENFTLLSTMEAMLAVADGKSALNPEADREGIVIRPKVETVFNGERLSFKVISNSYLVNEA